MLAILNNNVELARYLAASQRIDVSLRDRDNMSCLHLAVAMGQLEVVRTILNHNTANLNSKERCMGRTPLHLACMLKGPTPEISTNQISNISSMVSISFNTTQHTLNSSIDKTCLNVQTERSRADEECNNTGDFNAEDQNLTRGQSSTGMTIHAMQRCVASADNSNQSKNNNVQQTAVQQPLPTKGCLKGKSSAYLQTGSLSAQSAYKRNPKSDPKQQNAVTFTNKPSTKSKLQQKMVPQLSAPGSHHTVNAKRDADTSRHDLQECAQNTSNIAVLRCKMVSLLLEQGADANLMTLFRKSALHMVAALGASDVMALLLGHTTNPNMLSASNKTALHLAVEHGHASVVSLLIQAKANLGLRDLEGLTALHMAANLGHADIAVMLIKAGADVNSTDFKQKTPLHHACQNGRLALVDILIQAGCRTDIVDDSGVLARNYKSCIAEEKEED